MIVAVAHPLEIIYGDGLAMACGTMGELHAEALHGLFAGDTRVLSTLRFTIAGHAWTVLSRERPGPSTAQWEMQNPAIRIPSGVLDEGMIHFRLRRRVLGTLHDDLAVTSFADRVVSLRFTVQIDADFADIFQVKARSTPARLNAQRIPHTNGISFVYEHLGFRRALHATFHATGGTVEFLGTQIVFDLELEPRVPWRCCIEAVPEIDGHRMERPCDPHTGQLPRIDTSELAIAGEPLLVAPFDVGRLDLDRLAITDEHGRFIAAGAPWFLALFGRDTLVTSLMAGLLGSWHGRGALAALAATQARERDDFRDAQPGKIAHELRHGELAHARVIPHTPYYGTHDAPALFVLALWNVYRWTGHRALVNTYLPAAQAALDWCERAGDEDGDGLLEYRTRSKRGYYNQGWKDAGDAVPHADGPLAELPLATVELQGYWYAARLAMAELLDVVGQRDRADSQRRAARDLRARIEDRYWMADAGCYALALDGRKRQVASIASNQGHLLWCGVPSPERALRVAERLLAGDMFSGYGVRTLSSAHCRYNPLAYQLGSVWPHDCALCAAGFARYGLREHAARVFRAVLEAADAFEDHRLPELFCGFARAEGPPVPYERANVPQAWAAAAPILAAQIFLGLVPDAGNGRCFLSPWLPDWLPALELRGIELGDGHLAVKIVRDGRDARIEYADHATLEIVVATPPAPLWGDHERLP